MVEIGSVPFYCPLHLLYICTCTSAYTRLFPALQCVAHLLHIIFAHCYSTALYILSCPAPHNTAPQPLHTAHTLNYAALYNKHVHVRVGEPRKIFKPHSQISRLGMWTICFPIYTKGFFIGVFSRKFYDDVVNCIFFLFKNIFF